MKIFKRLFCKHEYKFVKSEMIDCGVFKMVIHRCEKCGKEKVYYV